jgi:hypothetical protein
MVSKTQRTFLVFLFLLYFHWLLIILTERKYNVFICFVLVTGNPILILAMVSEEYRYLLS